MPETTEPPTRSARVDDRQRSLRLRPGDVRRGAYLLPSLFTIGNILLGFYSIVLGLRGDVQLAVLLIFGAAILDGLDGRMARVTNTASDFGREFDSLADVITFGVAPALLVYWWALQDLGRIGWMLPAFFLLCAAIRLARFNVQTSVSDSRYFVGLPSPAAAGALGSILYFSAGRSEPGLPQVVLAVALVTLGLMMLSNFRYYSFKELDPRRRWTFRIAAPLAATVLLVAFNPAAFFLIVSGSYALSGPTTWLRGQLRRKDPAPVEQTSSGDDPP